MIKEIKQLYDQLLIKGDFDEVAARKFGKNRGTIKNHWISNENLPIERQKEFLSLLRKALKIQQKYKNSLNNL